MGKTRHLFNKTGDIKRKFHARMGMIRDRKRKNLIDAEEIKMSCKNTQKNDTSKALMTS